MVVDYTVHNHESSVSIVDSPRVSDPGGQHVKEDRQRPRPQRYVPDPAGATKAEVSREAGQATVSDGAGPVSSQESPTRDVRRVVVVNKDYVQYSMPSVSLSPKNSMFPMVSPKISNDLSEVYLKAYNVNASPIDVIRFRQYLAGYPSKLFIDVLDLIKNGANLHSSLKFDPSRSAPPNQKSTEIYKDLVDQYVWSKLKLNRIAGPFLHRPPGLVVSPLGAVPKRNSYYP